MFRALADTMSDRFLFAPSVGLIVVFVFSIGKLLKLDFSKTQISDVFSLASKKYNGAKYGFVTIMLLLSVLTFSRNKVWKNNETLITHDLPLLENCSRAHSYYADILKQNLQQILMPV